MLQQPAQQAQPPPAEEQHPAVQELPYFTKKGGVSLQGKYAINKRTEHVDYYRCRTKQCPGLANENRITGVVNVTQPCNCEPHNVSHANWTLRHKACELAATSVDVPMSAVWERAKTEHEHRYGHFPAPTLTYQQVRSGMYDARRTVQPEPVHTMEQIRGNGTPLSRYEYKVSASPHRDSL